MSESPAPILTYVLTPHGLVPTAYRVFSLPEAVSFEPAGVYTVARTFFGDRALLLDAHLDRMEESARLVGIPLVLDRARLRAALRDLLHHSGYADAKFRVTVPQNAPDQIYLALESFKPVPAEIMAHGAHVITVPLVRENPVAKTTEWMIVRRPAYEALPTGVYEGVLVNDAGLVLEGFSSNFYGVLAGVLRTAGEGVLAGITRRAIYELASSVLPVRDVPLHVDDLPRLSEAMLTSSGRGVVPITRINDRAVGDGQVGPIVRRLQERYDAWTAQASEPI